MKRGGKGREPDPMEAFEEGRAMIPTSAAAVADRLLASGARSLDALFGDGYARANPDLLGRYLDAATRIFEGDMASVAASAEDDDGFDGLFDDLDRRRR